MSTPFATILAPSRSMDALPASSASLISGYSAASAVRASIAISAGFAGISWRKARSASFLLPDDLRTAIAVDMSWDIRASFNKAPEFAPIAEASISSFNRAMSPMRNCTGSSAKRQMPIAAPMSAIGLLCIAVVIASSCLTGDILSPRVPDWLKRSASIGFDVSWFFCAAAGCFAGSADGAG